MPRFKPADPSLKAIQVRPRKIERIVVARLSAFSFVAKSMAFACFPTLNIEKRVRAGNTIVAVGEHPNHCCLLANGFVFRSKTMMDGQREPIRPPMVPETDIDNHLTELVRISRTFGSHCRSIERRANRAESPLIWAVSRDGSNPHAISIGPSLTLHFQRVGSMAVTFTFKKPDCGF